MRRLLRLSCVGAAMLLMEGTRGDPSRSAAKDVAPLKAAMPVGNRNVVEHWYPASKLPTVAPVLGIAELIR